MTTLKAYIDAIPPLIPGGGLASMNSVDLGSTRVTGTLAAARFPALNGDAATAAGSLALTLASTGVTPGTYSNATLTVDAKGRITAASGGAAGGVSGVFGRSGAVTAAAGDYAIGQIAGAGALASLNALDLGSSYATGTLAAGRLPALTGDVTTAAGSAATTLATVNANVGTFNTVTVNAKGLVTAATNSATPVVEVTGTAATMTPNTIYIANNASLVTLTLPATFAQGDFFLILGKGAGGWLVAQNAGQAIRGLTSTTTGAAGSLASSNRYDNVALRGITANSELEASARNGSLVVA